MIIGHDCQPLITIVTMSLILDVGEALDSPYPLKFPVDSTNSEKLKMNDQLSGINNSLKNKFSEINTAIELF